MKPICPYPNVRCYIAFVDTKKAQEFLASNPSHQRKVSRKNVAKIQSDIEHDRWFLSGESMIFGKSGAMLDGQHRCYGIVNARKGIWSVIVEGIDDEMFHLINTGKSRSLADVLKIAGEKDSVNLAATLVKLVQYLRSPTSVSTNAPVTTSEAMDVLSMLPRVRESVKFCRNASLADVARSSRVAWLHCITQEFAPAKSDKFFAQLSKGEHLSASDPAYVLRARLTADRDSKAKLLPREVTAIIIKAWNSFFAGKQMKQLRWTDQEAFPTLVVPDHSS